MRLLFLCGNEFRVIVSGKIRAGVQVLNLFWLLVSS